MFDFKFVLREIGQRLGGRKSWVTPVARRAVPWRAVDVICVLLLWLVTAFTIAPVFSAFRDLDEGQRQIWGGIAHSVATVVLAIAYLKFVARATWRDLGFDVRKLPGDVLRGVFAFLLIAPVVYGLQALLVQFVTYQHPVLETVKTSHTYLLALTSAVLTAPLAEEFIFRVFFQGWLETQPWLGTRPNLAARTANENPNIVAQPPLTGPTPPRPIDSANPFASPALLPDEQPDRGSVAVGTVDQSPRLPSKEWGPIAISSILFAAMHIGQGPAPIPLFFLALVLGYLYRQTHRIWPSLVVHLLLNGCTMAVICWNLSHGDPVP